jgi:hypothetical protein
MREEEKETVLVEKLAPRLVCTAFLLNSFYGTPDGCQLCFGKTSKINQHFRQLVVGAIEIGGWYAEHLRQLRRYRERRLMNTRLVAAYAGTATAFVEPD